MEIKLRLEICKKDAKIAFDIINLSRGRDLYINTEIIIVKNLKVLDNPKIVELDKVKSMLIRF